MREIMSLRTSGSMLTEFLAPPKRQACLSFVASQPSTPQGLFLPAGAHTSASLGQSWVKYCLVPLNLHWLEPLTPQLPSSITCFRRPPALASVAAALCCSEQKLSWSVICAGLQAERWRSPPKGLGGRLPPALRMVVQAGTS